MKLSQPLRTALTLSHGGSITIQTGFWREKETWWPHPPVPGKPILVRSPHWVWLSHDEVNPADLHIFGGLYVTNFTTIDLRPRRSHWNILAKAKSLFRLPIGHGIIVYDGGWLWIQDSIFKTARFQFTESDPEILLAEAI